MFLRKSLAPRTSPYSVAPQFGHAIQNSMNGMSVQVAQLKPPEKVEVGMPVPEPIASIDENASGYVSPSAGTMARPLSSYTKAPVSSVSYFCRLSMPLSPP